MLAKIMVVTSSLGRIHPITSEHGKSSGLVAILIKADLSIFAYIVSSSKTGVRYLPMCYQSVYFPPLIFRFHTCDASGVFVIIFNLCDNFNLGFLFHYRGFLFLPFGHLVFGKIALSYTQIF